MSFLIHRLKEPSTWAGMASFLAALGVSTELSNVIVGACAGLAALVAMAAPAKNGD